MLVSATGATPVTDAPHVECGAIRAFGLSQRWRYRCERRYAGRLGRSPKSLLAGFLRAASMRFTLSLSDLGLESSAKSFEPF